MAKRAPNWAAMVAEAEESDSTRAEVAAKYGATEAALKYHIYRARKAGRHERTPRLLPLRTEDERAALVVEFGAVRLSFRDGCDADFVAAVVRALSEAC
jgi:predicted transcriptional regulator